MKLKDFAKHIKGDVIILWFKEDGTLGCEKYSSKNINNIFLDMEVMDVKAEYDYLEVWVK